MCKNFSLKNTNILFFALCVLFLISRIVFLESDLPHWDIFNYQPIDELGYNNTAFNLFHYSDIQHRILPYVESDSITPNLFENLITYLTLTLFGNNYYGLRMASVFASFSVFVLFFLMLKNRLAWQELQGTESSPKHLNFIVFGCLIYLFIDFSFLLAGRVAEPTIFRMLSLVLLLYFFSIEAIEKHIYSRWFACLAGFIAVASVFYVYPSNAFIVPAAWSVCFYAGLQGGFKRGIFHTGGFLLGGIVCLITYELTLRGLFNKSYIDQVAYYSEFLSRVDLPGGGGSASSIILIKRYAFNIFGIFSANIFRLNPILLAVFLGTLPIFIFNTIKKRGLWDIFLAGLLVFLFLQLIFLNDYFHRKLVIILPMILLVIAAALAARKEFFDYLSNRKKLAAMFKGYSFLCIGFTLAIFLLNCTKHCAGHSTISGQMPILLSAFILQLSSILYMYRVKVSRYAGAATLIFIVIPSIYLEAKYIYIKPTHSYRDTMISLSKYIDGEIVVGGMANGFRLYNTSLPVIDGYGYKGTEEGRKKYKILRDRIISEHRARYTILYNMPGRNLFYVGNEVYDKKLNLVFEFNLINIVNGEKERISLYQYRS